MKDETESIDIFKVLNFIRDKAPEYAKAKANRIYMDEYRKSLKSQLFFEALEHGQKTIAEREAYAYAHPSYKAHLVGLNEAVEVEETLRWLLVGAQAKEGVWRTMEASNRFIDRSHQ